MSLASLALAVMGQALKDLQSPSIAVRKDAINFLVAPTPEQHQWWKLAGLRPKRALKRHPEWQQLWAQLMVHTPESWLKAERNRLRQRRNEQNWKARRLAEGLCYKCGKRPLVTSRFCEPCRQKNRLRGRKYWAEAGKAIKQLKGLVQGRCQTCGVEVVEQNLQTRKLHTRCLGCRAKQAAQDRQDRRQKTLMRLQGQVA